MVHTGPKNKIFNARHNLQAKRETAAWQLQNQEEAAYDRFLVRHNYTPAFGTYRNIAGAHFNIVPFGNDWNREYVAPENRISAPGSIWVPVFPQGEPGKPFDWNAHARACGNEFDFWAAMEIPVGFSELGFKRDREGRKWRVFQLNQLMLEEMEGFLICSPVPTITLDKTREHYRQAADGTYEVVPPNPVPQDAPMTSNFATEEIPAKVPAEEFFAPLIFNTTPSTAESSAPLVFDTAPSAAEDFSTAPTFNTTPSLAEEFFAPLAFDTAPSAAEEFSAPLLLNTTTPSVAGEGEALTFLDPAFFFNLQ